MTLVVEAYMIGDFGHVLFGFGKHALRFCNAYAVQIGFEVAIKTIVNKVSNLTG